MSTKGTSIHSPGQDSASADELRMKLRRLRSYARALEQRCDRLWTYVPDTHGRHDPAVPFVASEYDVSDLDRDPDAG